MPNKKKINWKPIDWTLDSPSEDEEQPRPRNTFRKKTFRKIQKKEWVPMPKEESYEAPEVKCVRTKDVERHCSDCGPNYGWQRSKRDPIDSEVSQLCNFLKTDLVIVLCHRYCRLLIYI